MKKVLISLVAIGAILGLLVLSNEHYANTQAQSKQNNNTVVEVSNLSAKLLKAEESLTQIQTQYNALKAECEKGLSAYNELTQITQTQVQAPICELAL